VVVLRHVVAGVQVGRQVLVRELARTADFNGVRDAVRHMLHHAALGLANEALRSVPISAGQ
jgi:hypothetical protein